MPWSELEEEARTIEFLGWEEAGELVGMMGWQQVHDATLIRHAYVLPTFQHQGIGSRLLAHIVREAPTPTVLVGTWAGATWAVRFYQGHGFVLRNDTAHLLARYWSVPPTQAAASVVLALEREGI
ncbi:MAG: GNAT family N-acetyltransferase [Chloroflexi bacterium]|nr:GNAT family N-acetyltransferase [Chloroflexota bacterium]